MCDVGSAMSILDTIITFSMLKLIGRFMNPQMLGHWHVLSTEIYNVSGHIILQQLV